MGANDPLGGTVSDSGDMIGRIYGKLNNTYQCCILNIKALGLVVSEMKFFFIFHFLWKIMTARDRPVLTPGTRLEEFIKFIKRSTIHCYTQNMKALGLVVSEMFSHCKSM